MPGHDYRPVDYDRLYYRLELEPGANEADIKHRYRHLAQILHPDKWRHPTAASVRWADEQFKRVKEARELLEAYWSVHHAPPVSRAALSVAQAEQLHGQMQALEAQRERVRGELDALRAERTRMLDEMTRMRIERDALQGELVGMRDTSGSDARYAAHEKYQAHQANEAHATRAQTMPQATARAPRSHGLRDALFARFDDPSRGWLLTLSASVVAAIVVFAIAHGLAGVLLAPVSGYAFGRALASGLQWLLTVFGVMLVFGWAWAQRTFYRAARAGVEHGVALPVDETLRRVNAALRHEGHFGANWTVESYDDASRASRFAMRAVLRFSPRAGQTARRQAVTFHCRAHASGPAQTALAYEFEVSAPTWWLVSSARVVRDLRKRIDADLGALR
ncbi:J domain-containing protein [Paraburkholderia acidisoli]|uniref:DnaJ domain-containing protein n=1 Tax=Paraburkholderia acidisoli TaxID=2571748 RepID=A0A7Z2JJP0_9BURK|nr:J domain-containing protein [Paraburkholderia acidisoli]QGZ66473.1 DnaJ domain-containing protein [Paraburkholderia acidisoli]